MAPRIAARLKTGLTADCTKLEVVSDEKSNGEPQFRMTRPAFGGNLMATIICPNTRPQMSTVRPGVMQKRQREEGRQGVVTMFVPKFDTSKFHVKLVETIKEDKAVVDIADAKILVSGGRGVQNKEGFDKLQALADVIGGVVSSSRAMVDNGVMPHDRQVGQTGKTVRPLRYQRCHPALGRYGRVRLHHRHQQGQVCAHLQRRRPRHRWRPAQDCPHADGEVEEGEGEVILQYVIAVLCRGVFSAPLRGAVYFEIEFLDVLENLENLDWWL